MSAPRGVDVVCRELSYHIGSPKKTILSHINIGVRRGEMVAVIGPSGAGKTTLLNLVAARTNRGHIEGEISYNGQVASHSTVKGFTNYVMAHDRLRTYLKVEETLRSAAWLKMPTSSKQEIDMAVHKALDYMDLHECKDNYIGGESKKGISSGELKRLCLGIELLDNPSLILCDEPNNGLDAHMAYQVMSYLRAMCKDSGRTVISVIHQPSSRIYNLFDRVILMSGGAVLYNGPPGLALDHFKSIGYTPKNSNVLPSDFMLDLATPRPTSDPKLNQLTTDELEAMAADWPSTEMGLQQSDTMDRLVENSEASFHNEERDYAASMFTCMGWKRIWSQFWTLWWRSTKNSARDPFVFYVVAFVALFLGITLGTIFWNHDDDNRDASLMPAVFTDYSNAFKYGIDGQGASPLLDILIDGVDGNGSTPLLDLASPDVLGLVSQSAQCLYEQHNLGCYGYPEAVFTDYWLNPTSTPTTSSTISTSSTSSTSASSTSTTPQGTAWSDLDIGPHDIFTPLMQFIQTAHFFAHPKLSQMDEILVKANSCTDVLCTACAVNPILDRTLNCLGIPTGIPVACVPFENSTPDHICWRGEEPVPPPTLGRRLQIAGGTGSTTDLSFLTAFLPENVAEVAAAVGALVTRLTTCGNKFCDAFSTLGKAGRIVSVILASVNINGCLFFASATVGFISYDVLLTFPAERVIFNRERANGMYGTFVYFLAKQVADFPFQVLPTLCFAIPYYWMVGLAPTGSQFFKFLYVCVCVNIAAYGFGYLVSAVSRSQAISLLIAPFTVVIMVTVSGFFVRDNALPVWIAWFRYLSMYRWGFFAMVLNEFPINGTWGGLPGSFHHTLAGVSLDSFWFTASFSILLGLGYRFLGYLSLKFTNKKIGLEA